MVRELRRLLIEPARMADRASHEGRLPLQQDEQHYLSRVLRLRTGEAVTVIDGCGGLWRARLGEGPWLDGLEREREPSPQSHPRLCLALALPRQDVEVVWRMATEIGTDRLQPLRAERCQGSGRRPAVDRWWAIVREATEQCERLWLPRLDSLECAADWLSRPGVGLRLLATTRRERLPSLEACLKEADAMRVTPAEITLAIGPEGGWTPREEDSAEAAGWIAVSLGDTILRTTTAAVSGISRLAAWRQLSC